MTPASTPGGAYRLGDHPVARIGFGAMQLTPHGGAPLAREEALALLRRARELGVNHIDTAQFYGDGGANDLLREALGPAYEGLTIATKVGAVVGGPGLVPAQHPAQLREAVEANLRALGTERLGVVNLRRLDAQPGILASGDQVADLNSQLAELVAMREEGKIEAIGLSNVSEEQIRAALPAGIACVQNIDNLLARAPAPVRDLCREEQIAWVPFFPLGSAFPGSPKVKDDPVVQECAAELGATPAQVGLAWLLAEADNTLLIPGTGSVAHLEQNVAVGDIRLSEQMFARIAARSA